MRLGSIHLLQSLHPSIPPYLHTSIPPYIQLLLLLTITAIYIAVCSFPRLRPDTQLHSLHLPLLLLIYIPPPPPPPTPVISNLSYSTLPVALMLHLGCDRLTFPPSTVRCTRHSYQVHTYRLTGDQKAVDPFIFTFTLTLNFGTSFVPT